MAVETRPIAQCRGTRARLLDSAQSLFAEQGYAATSMRQIAKKSGLALGGIYNHFRSKEEMFQTLLLDRNLFQRPDDQFAHEGFDRHHAKILLEDLKMHPEFFNLILIELLEFKGRHLSTLIDITSDDISLSFYSALFSLVVSFGATQILLASAFPSGSHSQPSIDAFLNNFLNDSFIQEIGL